MDDALVLRMLELALKAPSGGNRQNVEFVVVREPAVKAQLARLNRVAWRLYGPVWWFFARNEWPPLALRLRSGPVVVEIGRRSASRG